MDLIHKIVNIWLSLSYKYVLTTMVDSKGLIIHTYRNRFTGKYMKIQINYEHNRGKVQRV